MRWDEHPTEKELEDGILECLDDQVPIMVDKPDFQSPGNIYGFTDKLDKASDRVHVYDPKTGQATIAGMQQLLKDVVAKKLTFRVYVHRDFIDQIALVHQRAHDVLEGRGTGPDLESSY